MTEAWTEKFDQDPQQLLNDAIGVLSEEDEVNRDKLIEAGRKSALAFDRLDDVKDQTTAATVALACFRMSDELSSVIRFGNHASDKLKGKVHPMIYLEIREAVELAEVFVKRTKFK